MNVSFTGYKNLVGLSGKSEYIDGRVHNLLVQVNDVGTKDSQNFEKTLKVFPDVVKNNFLKIQVIEGSEGTLLLLNGKKVSLESDEHLGLIAKIADLTKRIFQDDSKMVVDRDFIDGDDFKKLIFRDPVVNFFDIKATVDAMFKKENINNAAEGINNAISKAMSKYFNCG